MAKTCTYTVLAPGGNLTTTAQSDIYRYAVVIDINNKWTFFTHCRDMRAAMGIARTMMNRGGRSKVVEAVLTAVDGVPIPGAVEKRMHEKLGRLKANSVRTYHRAVAAMKEGDNSDKVLFGDYKAYERWIDEIKAQIKAV